MFIIILKSNHNIIIIGRKSVGVWERETEREILECALSFFKSLSRTLESGRHKLGTPEFRKRHIPGILKRPVVPFTICPIWRPLHNVNVTCPVWIFFCFYFIINKRRLEDLLMSSLFWSAICNIRSFILIVHEPLFTFFLIFRIDPAHKKSSLRGVASEL